MNISGENTMKLYASMKKRILSHFPLRMMAAAVLFILPGAAFAAPLSQVFKADLTPLNESAGGGAKGTVTLTVNGDELTIEAEVTGLNPPGNAHDPHPRIHGREQGSYMRRARTG